jgi:hypothetical protein
MACSARARPYGRSAAPSLPPPGARRTCWCWARAAPARSWWLRRCTRVATGLESRWSRATRPRSPRDSELFGNLRNYPNSGTPERPGLIGQADGSTLLFDEFAELPPSLQAHLLRVLDGGEYQRLGEANEARERRSGIKNSKYLDFYRQPHSGNTACTSHHRRKTVSSFPGPRG